MKQTMIILSLMILCVSIFVYADTGGTADAEDGIGARGDTGIDTRGGSSRDGDNDIDTPSDAAPSVAEDRGNPGAFSGMADDNEGTTVNGIADTLAEQEAEEAEQEQQEQEIAARREAVEQERGFIQGLLEFEEEEEGTFRTYLGRPSSLEEDLENAKQNLAEAKDRISDIQQTTFKEDPEEANLRTQLADAIVDRTQLESEIARLESTLGVSSSGGLSEDTNDK